MESERNKESDNAQKYKHQQVREEESKESRKEKSEQSAATGRGWGGWTVSPLSVFSDLQRAAGEISRSAIVIAQTAAKGIEETSHVLDFYGNGKEGESVNGKEVGGEKENLRNAALDKLEKASEDSLFGQGLKVLDNSVENFASEAWQALGNAWRGGAGFVHKIEESIQHGAASSLAPTLLESGKAFTAKGVEVLELVGKEAMDLLMTETRNEAKYVDLTFDHCFYIYGGLEQLQELGALQKHHALSFNRRKGRLPCEQRDHLDLELKRVQSILRLSTEMNETFAGDHKGKQKEAAADESDVEMKNLHDSSVRKASDLAAGLSGTLAELGANELLERTVTRLESLHSEGIHRISEMCAVAISKLLAFAKSVVLSRGGAMDEEDSMRKAEMIRLKAQTMAEYIEDASSCFIAGISVAETCFVSANDSQESSRLQKSIRQKIVFFSDQLRVAKSLAFDTIQKSLHELSFLILPISVP